MNILIIAYLIALSVCVLAILFVGLRMIWELIKTYSSNDNPPWRY